MQFAPDGDLFALGVTLWEWLFGAKPYASPAIGDSPIAPQDAVPAISTPWLHWLKRAVATRSAERFSSAREMLQAFQDADAAEERPLSSRRRSLVTERYWRRSHLC